MIDDDEAEQSETGEHHGATGDPAASVSSADPPPPPADAQPPDDGQPPYDGPPRGEGLVADHRPVVGDDGLAAGGELEVAEDVGLGEAERALLEWALRQRQSGPGEPLLRVAKAIPEATPEPATPPEPVAPPEPVSEAAPEPEPEAPPAPSDDEPRSPWDVLYGSAEEAITALVAAGGPDPRDFASPRLTRRAKMVIALALVVLFVVSALGGFVGYRLTHRAAGSGPEAVGRLADIRGGIV